MAEIRSTMDMVMERAAKIAAQADEKSDSVDHEKEGMRLAAEYLNTREFDLLAKLQALDGDKLKTMLSGVSKTLLRNIVLPRDETPSEASLLSLQTALDLGGANQTISQTCAEIKQILEQYTQHKEQVQQQVEEALAGQLQQQAMAQGQEIDGPVNPKLHPQYQEEMGKVLTDLNGQYTQALDERKEIIRQQLIQ